MARGRILEHIARGTLFPDQQDVLTPVGPSSVVVNRNGSVHSVHFLFCTTEEGSNGVEMSC